MDLAQIDQLIVASLQGRLSAAKEAELRAWRDESPENNRRYLDTAAIWSTLQDEVGEPREQPRAGDVLKLAQQRQREAQAADSPRHRPSSSRQPEIDTGSSPN